MAVTPELVRTAVTLTAPPSGMPVDPDETEWFYLLAKHYRFRYPPPPLTDQQPSRLIAPILFLMGAHDPFFVAHNAVSRARVCLPNLYAAEVVAGVGHNMINEKPELINQRLLEFLSAAGASDSECERRGGE
jgi:pimeloyl-ACP methyl ester carboxylesterase